jgi:hypothetical protein
MQKYLSFHDQSVPPILKTLSGNDYLLIGDRIFFITPYIEGKYYSGKKRRLFRLASSWGNYINYQ